MHIPTLLLVLGCDGGTIGDVDTAPPAEPSPYANCNGHSQVDDDYDGELEETHDLRYDANGNLVYYSTDDGADGVLDSAYSYQVTDSGEYLVTELDEEGDGNPDARWTFIRDDDELLERVDYDEGIDGTIDAVSTVVHTFTDDGDPETMTTSKDDGVDGTVDEIEIKTWDYDTTGYWTINDNDRDADGTPELRYEARFDYDDVKLRHRTDYGVDDTYEKEAEFRFDEHGRVYRVDVITLDAAGAQSLAYVFNNYDEGDRVSEMLFDDGRDGSIEGRTAFAWDCN